MPVDNGAALASSSLAICMSELKVDCGTVGKFLHCSYAKVTSPSLPYILASQMWILSLWGKKGNP